MHAISHLPGGVWFVYPVLLICLIWQQKAASLICAGFLEVSCTAYHIWTKDPVHRIYLKCFVYVIFYAYIVYWQYYYYNLICVGNIPESTEGIELREGTTQGWGPAGRHLAGPDTWCHWTKEGEEQRAAGELGCSLVYSYLDVMISIVVSYLWINGDTSEADINIDWLKQTFWDRETTYNAEPLSQDSMNMARHSPALSSWYDVRIDQFCPRPTWMILLNNLL